MIVRFLAVVALLWSLGFAAFMLATPRPLDDTVRTDALIVPTGAPGRIDRGLALLADGAARRMLVTGVDPDVRPVELAEAYDRPRRLFTCCVDLGHDAVDTRSNADESAEWVRRRGYRSVRLVTSDWHMARAALELRHAVGDEVTVLPDPVPGTPRFGLLLDEYNKYLVRRAILLLGIAV